MVRWLVTLKVAGSPFPNFHARRGCRDLFSGIVWLLFVGGRAGFRVGGGCGWVEHNVWFMVFRCASTCGGVAGFGTLLGPEETPPVLLGVFFLAAPGLDRLTLCLSGWWWLFRCWGVVVC